MLESEIGSKYLAECSQFHRKKVNSEIITYSKP
jgi:hypothetical protein